MLIDFSLLVEKLQDQGPKEITLKTPIICKKDLVYVI